LVFRFAFKVFSFFTLESLTFEPFESFLGRAGMTNEYLPLIAKIEEVKEQTKGIRTFVFSIGKDTDFSYKAGQFIMLSVFGFGEGAFSPSSFPVKDGKIEVTIARVGKLTTRLFEMERGARVGIRGAFGNGFDLERVRGRDILLVAGGIGMGALKPLLEVLLLNRNLFGRIDLLFGTRTPSDMPFKEDLELWEKSKALNIKTTVDSPDGNWKGDVGFVSLLLGDFKTDAGKTTAFVCGPPQMLPSVFERLLAKGFNTNQIITSLERHMKCGIGFCGHCRINENYVCTDGPVFSYDEIERMERKL